MKVIITAGILFLLAGCMSNVARSQPAVADLALCNVSLIDVDEGHSDRTASILISNGKVVGHEARCPSRNGARQVVDLSGRYLLPGLWDMHVHALWSEQIVDEMLPRFTAYGVLGVRDMGGDLPWLQRARDHIASGSPYPHIVAAGRVLDGPQPVDPSISLAVSDKPEAREAVRRLTAADADFIKVYTLLPKETLTTVVDEARARGLVVAGHVPAGIDPAEAAAIGMKSIEHMRDEIEPICVPGEGGCERYLEAFRQNGTYLTPTLVILDKSFVVDEEALADPEYLSLPDDLTTYWRSSRDRALAEGEAYVTRKHARYAMAAAQTRYFHQGGVPILAGSDAGVPASLPGRALHEELRNLVDAGLPAAAAIAAATTVPRRYFGIEGQPFDVGSDADFVILSANPLENIDNSRRIEGVVLRGRYLERRVLDELLSK